MRNGSGTYSAPSGSFNPATNGNSATAADWNTLLADLVAAMTQSVSADGQTPITGNFNMGNNKLTSLGAGSATGQSLAWQQLFSQGTESDLASAGTTDIGAQNTNFLRITGTTSITSFGTNYNGPRFLRFAGALTLTNSGTLILPTGANITTAAGDVAIAIPISGGWYVAAYQRASGAALITSTDFLNTTRIDVASAGTVDLTASAPNTRHINITGTTTITGFTVAVGQCYFVRFNAVLTLTNSGTLVTQTGANITTAAGDTCIVRATAANTVEILAYSPAGLVPSSATPQPNGTAAAGSAISYARADHVHASGVIVRAFVMFNGTGTPAILASNNVTSITDNGTGDYTINFTSALSSANYAVALATDNSATGAPSIFIDNATAPTTSALRIGCTNNGGTRVDNARISVTVFL